jgi:disulfide bond formation protein DsbB
MSGGRTGRQRARSGVLLALALYALIVAVAPAFHHDVACHLTSPTHCTACTATPAAPRTEQALGVQPVGLAVAGRVNDPDERALQAAPSFRIPARAPPA